MMLLMMKSTLLVVEFTCWRCCPQKYCAPRRDAHLMRLSLCVCMCLRSSSTRSSTHIRAHARTVAHMRTYTRTRTRLKRGHREPCVWLARTVRQFSLLCNLVPIGRANASRQFSRSTHHTTIQTSRHPPPPPHHHQHTPPTYTTIPKTTTHPHRHAPINILSQ